ncbi:sensor histidine kinase [Mucilaginibacter pocheonensis]|uniref:Signal transduction histidine kinase n=1 Tax=Mucilaginibacter pocheonensis TaxID=398050 RepID=A0ABU1TE02_9SPHI|nr:histidine kinase [Mucilaginibacter pocheonensis]MDR6943592.1 signal transduction histidine kinase [Mucilaginibacter pocheonensis]
MTTKRILKSIFPAVYGLIVYATIRLLQDTETGFHFWVRPMLLTSMEIVLSIVVGYLNIYMINRVCNLNDQRQSAYKLTSSLLWREILTVALLNTITVNLFFTPLTAFTGDGLSWADLASINVVPLLYTLIYYGVIRSGRFLTAYVQHQLLVEKLTTDQLETELKFLKAQYHPHFLFNALNTIYFQMDDDVPGAKKSTELLSSLLRYQLYDQQQQVSVRQELEYLENYIQLQKIRASKKMRLTINFDEKLADQQVYPLLLLPLVENAFKYAGGKYVIDIVAKATADGILFKVYNDIPGQIKPSDNYGGIGLENLKRRLHLLYPGKHRLVAGAHENSYIAELELKF